MKGRAMSKISQRILKKAHKLFTKNGYDKVSLRNIAEAAGTTIGNLTYHFPQKENLIEGIQKQLQEDFSNDMLDAEEKNENALEGFLRVINRFQQEHKNSIYCYKNMVELCRDSENFAKRRIQFRERIFQFFVSSFARMVDDGTMRNDISGERYSTLAHVLVMVGALWIQNSSYSYNPILEKLTMESVTRDMIYPYFTPKGADRFKKALEVLEGEGRK